MSERPLRVDVVSGSGSNFPGAVSNFNMNMNSLVSGYNVRYVGPPQTVVATEYGTQMYNIYQQVELFTRTF